MSLINYVYKVFYFLTTKKRISFLSRYDIIFSMEGKRYSLEYESLVGDYNIELNTKNIFLLTNENLKQFIDSKEKVIVLRKAIEELDRMGLKAKVG